MKISLEDLGKIAGNFLYLMEKEGIEKTEDLEKRIGTTVKLEKSNDFVVISLKPSCYKSLAPSVFYISPNFGIPIELKINKEVKISKLGYSKIFIKSQERIKNYNFLRKDSYDNFMQKRIFYSSDFSVVKKELERLKEICEICKNDK